MVFDLEALKVTLPVPSIVLPTPKSQYGWFIVSDENAPLKSLLRIVLVVVPSSVKPKLPVIFGKPGAITLELSPPSKSILYLRN